VRCVDHLPAADVQADVVDGAGRVPEEDEIARKELGARRQLRPRVVLILGDARE
jgi:hypothetical protein